MAPAPFESSPRLLRFGPFEADLRTRELRKNGVRVRLSGMPFEVLAALLEHPGELVTRDELRKRLWAEDTFVDYENSLNSSVARLRDVLGDSAEHPRFIETLPKRGYRFLAAVIAEPSAQSDVRLEPVATPARLNSDAPVRVTPETIDVRLKPDTTSQPSPSAIVARGGRRSRVAWAGALGLAVAAVLVFLPGLRERERATGRVMLAVLPFDNMSADKDREYISDGFTEELITQLARANPEKFGVIARTTAMRYKGGMKDVAHVGRELGVDYVLEGSVRERDGSLRITAQLIRVADQTHVWAESFDREARNLLDVERDVSEAVSRQVHLLVGPAASVEPHARPPVHPDAYEAYLRARYHHAQATVSGIESAIRFYRKAVELDPAYALAHAGLARAYIFGVRMRPREALAQAHQAALEALALDSELPEAQLALAMTKLYYEWDWAGSEREFRRAIARDDGSADAHFYYSHYLAAVGRHDEAIAEARRAQQLDPHAPLIGHYVGRHFYMARRYDQAVRELRRTLELDPNYGWTHVFLFLTYEKLGRMDEALAHRQKYLTLIGRSPEEATALAKAYGERGYPAVIEKWNEVTLDYFKQTGHLTSAEIVHGYAALDRNDVALDWLDRAFADHTRDLIYLNVDPGYEGLRDEPRFQARLRQLNLPGSNAELQSAK